MQTFNLSASLLWMWTFNLSASQLEMRIVNFREIRHLSPCFAILWRREYGFLSYKWGIQSVSPEVCIERLVIKDVEDEKYRLLLNKEYQFCMDNAERIQKKANKIYEMVTTNRKQKLTDNSCAFRILEQGCREYIENVLRTKC